MSRLTEFPKNTIFSGSIEFENFETSIEWLQSLDSFSELDADRDQPSAWNLEMALYLNDIYEIGLRLEGSKELEDAAERQAGIAMTIHAIKNMTVTIDLSPFHLNRKKQ